jgi:hypothetical protein
MTTTLDPQASSPDSRFPTADSLPPSRRLPPTSRDFDIYQAVHVEGVSTRAMAARHEISQTRVRQVVKRVAEWVAVALPPQSDVRKERQAALAQHLAADRLHFAYQELMELWRQTKETKYLGQTIRLSFAQAKLGVIPGAAAGLIADAEDGLLPPLADELPETDDTATQASGSATGFTNAPPVKECSATEIETADQESAAISEIVATGDSAGSYDDQPGAETSATERPIGAYAPLLSAGQASLLVGSAAANGPSRKPNDQPAATASSPFNAKAQSSQRTQRRDAKL